MILTDSIRENLDPKKLFSDREIEKALADASFNARIVAREDCKNESSDGETRDS